MVAVGGWVWLNRPSDVLLRAGTAGNDDIYDDVDDEDHVFDDDRDDDDESGSG